MELFSLIFSAAVLSSVGSCVPRKEDGGPRLISTFQSDETGIDFDVESNVEFLLFTRKNQLDPQIIKINNASTMEDSNFDFHNPIRILIHGWRDDARSTIARLGKPQYYKKGDYNVIVVDWSKGASTSNYLIAVDRAYQVGALCGQFIDFLIESSMNLVQLDKIAIIGHSLGAHVAGIAGKNVKNGKVGWISGLDPAGPLFFMNVPHKRLDKDDAVFVQVLHTDRGTQGFSEPIGHADFYPNWGRNQPGCGSDFSGACSHQRSAYLWTESLNSPLGFWAVRCPNGYTDIERKNCKGDEELLMGGDPIVKMDGVFFLSTASKSPFAMGANVTEY